MFVAAAVIGEFTANRLNWIEKRRFDLINACNSEINGV